MSRRIAVAQTTFLPSVGILGATDPTIDWGNGTVDTLSSDAISCNYRDVTHVLAFCLLYGNHQWAFTGTYTITATYATGLEFSYSTSWQMTTVWPTDIRPTLTNIYPSPGQTFNGTVATFIDARYT